MTPKTAQARRSNDNRCGELPPLCMAAGLSPGASSALMRVSRFVTTSELTRVSRAVNTSEVMRVIRVVTTRKKNSACKCQIR